MQITDENIRELKEVVRRETPRLMRKKGVMSVCVALKLRNGRSTKTLCIQILVKQKIPLDQIALEAMIRIPGYPTDVFEIGSIYSIRLPHQAGATVGGLDECPTWGTAWKRDERYKILQGGINIRREGAPEQGTMGMVVYDALNVFSMPHLISCAHVIAKKETTSDFQNAFVEQGDTVKNNRIADVTRAIYRKANKHAVTEDEIDVAIARFINFDRDIQANIAEIKNFEPIIMEPKYGMEVVKSGARTGVTKGHIDSVEGNTIRFRMINPAGLGDDIIVCSGDSGSILLGKTEEGKLRPVGLIVDKFTLYSEGSYVHWGIATKLSAIVKEMKIRIEPQGGWLHRYWNNTLKTSTYVSHNKSSPQDLHPDYEYVEPSFEPASLDDLDVVPLHCYYNPSLKSHFFTTDNDAEGRKDLGYSFAGRVGYLSQVQKEGFSPLKRYFNPVRNDYMLAFEQPESGYEIDSNQTLSVNGHTIDYTSGRENINKTLGQGMIGHAKKIRKSKNLTTLPITKRIVDCRDNKLYICARPSPGQGLQPLMNDLAREYNGPIRWMTPRDVKHWRDIICHLNDLKPPNPTIHTHGTYRFPRQLFCAISASDLMKVTSSKSIWQEFWGEIILFLEKAIDFIANGFELIWEQTKYTLAFIGGIWMGIGQWLEDLAMAIPDMIKFFINLPNIIGALSWKLIVDTIGDELERLRVSWNTGDPWNDGYEYGRYCGYIFSEALIGLCSGGIITALKVGGKVTSISLKVEKIVVVVDRVRKKLTVTEAKLRHIVKDLRGVDTLINKVSWPMKKDAGLTKAWNLSKKQKMTSKHWDKWTMKKRYEYIRKKFWRNIATMEEFKRIKDELIAEGYIFDPLKLNNAPVLDKDLFPGNFTSRRGKNWRTLSIDHIIEKGKVPHLTLEAANLRLMPSILNWAISL